MRSAIESAGPVPALALVAVVAGTAAPLPAAHQTEQATFYGCVGGSEMEVDSIGLALCDAEPAPALLQQAEPDNLQVRDGALVSEVEEGGIAAVAGVQPGDMIYRVAGVDVTGAEEAEAGLVNVGTDSDTQINFLRRGRPYRIKLRR